MVRRHEAKLLRKVGRTQGEVRMVTGIAERSIRRIEREAPCEDFDDGAERRRRRIGRPSKIEPYLKARADLQTWGNLGRSGFGSSFGQPQVGERGAFFSVPTG